MGTQILIFLPITLAAFFILGLLVYFNGRRNVVNLTYCVFLGQIALWTFGLWMFYASKSPAVSLFWSKVVYLEGGLIPTSFLHFSFVFPTDQTKRYRLLPQVLYIPNLLIFLLLFFSPFIVKEVAFINGTKGFLYGHWRILWELQFHTAFGFAFYRFARSYKISSGLTKIRLRYVILGTLIGLVLSGPTNVILPWFNRFALVWLGPPVSLSGIAFIVYAITRYRLMDINLAITRTVVFTGVYALILGVPLIAALVWQPQLERFLGSRWWVWLLIAYAALATAAHYANQYFQERANERLLAEEHKAHDALEQISKNMMRFTRLKALLGSSVKNVVRILQVTHAAIYLFNEEENLYERKGVWHSPPRRDSPLPASISANSALLKDLVSVKLPRVREEISLQQQSMTSPWKEMAENLERLQASLVIPSFKQNRLFGFIALGEKRSRRIWTQDDLNVLTILANQTVLAIENAELHEAEEARLIKEAIEQTATDISYGVSHQFNNRLYVISILASAPVLSLADEDLEKLSPEAAKVWLRKLRDEMRKITSEAEMGGQISKGIMSLAKAIPENFKPIEIPSLIEHAIDFVRLKHAKEKVEGEQVEPEIVNDVPKCLSLVPGNAAQIHDSFMNLIDNAMDAIREKIYRTRRGELPAAPEHYKGRIRVRAEEKDGWISVIVEDDGIGIEKENMRRCFAPYFTTKATGIKGRGLGGHGLGLYFIKKIVEAHGGKVYVQSQHTQWTCFTVELPIQKKEESHAA